MKPKIQIKIGGSVVAVDAEKVQSSQAPESIASWDAMVKAIDLRAHYVGPVLEDILHLEHGRSPGISRE